MFIVRTSLQYSPIHGIGVFLKEPVRKGQVVWQFDPRVDVAIPFEELQNFPPAVQDYLKIYTYISVMNGRRVMVLCADNSKHVNHADDPNLVDTPDGLQEIAARDIAAGEELTCNYFASDLEAAAKLGRENA
jgi:SET domain-containing protein